MSEQRQIIHIRIRDLRRERSLTQEELAEALGLSRQSINAMEAGRCLPSLPVALQIASFFSVPLAAVFNFPVTADGELSISNPKEEEALANNPIPWSPLREIREALDELMDESINWQVSPQTSAPAINIWQDAEVVRVEAALPGFTTEELSIEVGEDFLTLAGEKGEESEEKQFSRREFTPRPFQRTVSLPAVVRVKDAQAELKNGLLTISVPKLEEEKPKTARVSINASE